MATEHAGLPAVPVPVGGDVVPSELDVALPLVAGQRSSVDELVELAGRDAELTGGVTNGDPAAVAFPAAWSAVSFRTIFHGLSCYQGCGA